MREHVAQVLLGVVLRQIAHVDGFDLLVGKGAVANARVQSFCGYPYWPGKDMSAFARTCVGCKAPREMLAGGIACIGHPAVQGHVFTCGAAITDGLLTFSVPISSRLGSAHMIWTWCPRILRRTKQQHDAASSTKLSCVSWHCFNFNAQAANHRW